ncbi:nuclease-related domain-containing DEAD/DEAH box helicase [Herbiconiux sp. VKM Ac-1786]|uniref:nuclease-related domain-containing DEAD/DEAH box helicase n=1 Tax=Herbiconiux sp. VKM Ac-1786 TaxID=2783824 RepID=UPI001E2F055B|nr:ATP-binding domain-containing protein [Herbiconiux sp. VKM Ac-1786]
MPGYCPSEAPPGERSIFEALSSSTETDGWVVLHSLAIASHVRQVEGEADFVIVVPGKGVVVIEVKSHLSVERLFDGRWKLGSQAPTGRGPFQQSREAMHSIRNFLVRSKVDLRSTPVLSAVWFTHVRARQMLPRDPEWNSWQLLDSEDLRKGAADAVERVLAGGLDHLRGRLSTFKTDDVGPNETESAQITKLLRPRFEMAQVQSDVRRARKVQLATLIDEQFDALDSMEENRAVLFTGPAGSGKTLLATEAARRESAKGGLGLLVCFNRLLAQHLESEAGAIPALRVTSFHRELLRIADLDAPLNPAASFWSEELPELAIEKLLKDDTRPQYEYLILDESQDLARPEYLDVLDLLVRGGLKEGRCLFFGDFISQSLFDAEDGRPELRRRVPGLVGFALGANCRNTPRIGTIVNTFSRLEPGYRRFRRPDDGINPQFHTYGRGEDQVDQLVLAISELRDDGFELDEIVILSPVRASSALKASKDARLSSVLTSIDTAATPNRGHLRYGTIQSFKGLEAPAVVLTDLETTGASYFDALLYVGLTRATDRLVALIEKNTLRLAMRRHDVRN